MQDQLAASNFLALSKKSFAIKFDLENTEYDSIENIGTGAYGVVCSAVHRATGEHVAIKKIPNIFEQMTIAMRTYREIRILKHFKHSNIISIREILFPKEDLKMFRDIYIVLDLMESDLHRIIYSQTLTNEHVRWFLYQILRGLKYIHSANVVHRDLKPSNLLVNGNCDLKIGDFGMARGIYSLPDDSNIKMTQYVATRWYRAPEIMLQSPIYSTGVDVWSVGCILAEMIRRKPLFPGKNLCDQLEMVFDVVGTPSASYVERAHSDIIKDYLIKWPGKKMVDYSDFALKFPNAAPKAIRLLRRFLNLDPKERLTVNEALDDPYLNIHHEPDDEPVCSPPFDFSFEKQYKDLFEKKELQPKILRDMISKEILDYHSEKLTAAERTDLQVSTDSMETPQTVPDESELQSFATAPENQEPSRTLNCDQNMSLKGELVLAEGSPLYEHSLQIEISVADDDHSLSLNIDTEMKSANSDSRLGVSPQEQLDSDVRMLSAKLEECSISTTEQSSISMTEQTLVDSCSNKILTENESLLLDTKAKIKAALLNVELRKQRIELGQKEKTASKPRTALQKQKEREEERRRKQEKALERKKKKKKNQDTSVPKGLILTDEDKSLLERWHSMQKTSQNLTSLSLNTKIFSTTNQTFQTITSVDSQINPLMSRYAGHLPNNGTLLHPGLNGKIPLSQTFGSMQNTSGTPSLLPSIIPLISQVNGMETLNRTAMVPGAEYGPQFDQSLLQGQSTAGLSSVETYSVLPPFGDGIACRGVTGNPVVWMPSVKAPVDNSIQVMNMRNCPPSYTEALAAKQLDIQKRSESVPQMLPMVGTGQNTAPCFQKYILNRQESEGFTLNNPDTVGISAVLPDVLARQPLKPETCIYELGLLSQSRSHCGESQGASSQSTNPSLSGFLQGRADDSVSAIMQETLGQPRLDQLQILNSRMMKSSVEELTLLHTPRGTGFGYGVGMDLGSFVTSTSALENRVGVEGPESAPLSATLMADWRDVTGDIDANDFEAALQLELQDLGSSILNDFNTFT